jgi:hypothetical protein
MAENQSCSKRKEEECQVESNVEKGMRASKLERNVR